MAEAEAEQIPAEPEIPSEPQTPEEGIPVANIADLEPEKLQNQPSDSDHQAEATKLAEELVNDVVIDNSLPQVDPIAFNLNHKINSNHHEMSEQEIVAFLQSHGVKNSELTFEDLKGFDHKQLDDYLLQTSLSEQQKHKIKHQIFHIKHKGHEAMH